MPRIRTIKPEIWCSRQFVECSTSARLLFIGFWNFADDNGVHPACEVRLKCEVFPADTCSPNDVLAWIRELVNAGLLIEYDVQSESYWQVTGWHHQKIDRPNARYPVPDDSTSIRRVLDESSPPETETETETETEKKERGSAPFNPRLLDLPFGTSEFKESWTSFCAHRSEKRQPLTKTSARALLAKLAKWGELRAIAALDHTVAMGWQGVREPEGEATSTNGRKSHHLTAEDIFGGQE